MIRVLFEEGWIVCPSAVSVLSLRAHVHADPPASTALPTVVPMAAFKLRQGQREGGLFPQMSEDELFRVPFEEARAMLSDN